MADFDAKTKEAAMTIGMRDLDTRYMSVSKEAGKLQQVLFPSLFKLYSKFAHPSAALVFNFVEDERLDSTCRLLFCLSAHFAKAANPHIGYFLLRKRKNGEPLGNYAVT